MSDAALSGRTGGDGDLDKPPQIVRFPSDALSPDGGSAAERGFPGCNSQTPVRSPGGRVQAKARPWQAAEVDPLDRRRRELFRLAAPVFRDHGYRGATIKALAYACHLTPAGLYHYFTSKADLATYVVLPRLDWRSVYVDPDREPIVQFSEFLDLAIRELPDFLLALDLAEELAVPGV